jgi:hypothetical protein
MRNLSYGNETRAERLITEKYDFLEKTSHTENLQCDSKIVKKLNVAMDLEILVRSQM